MQKKKLVVLTGAGISAESGIATFRDSNGLWEGHDVMEVASPEGWRRNKALVLDFYNQRRRQAKTVNPNKAHLTLAKLEQHFDVTIITQNVDNLHERAGSTNIIHLHGELFKSQSTLDPALVYKMMGTEINIGDKCEKGSQLRPFIVWFGEMVPMMEPAIEHALQADIFAVIGTSLQVYPAASLIQYAPEKAVKYIIDVKIPMTSFIPNLKSISASATEGTQIMAKEILTLK
ncbi:SIR2 family NAD-dependent protein deacylase [Belliella pelovolcani]|uniref:NAD-dependent protein deacylase n=1 Tax=Belliella pelovolcani TaxID=529505 RepID=A0A1N7Q0V2_9BACT|nr:NAD-dependent deacylase [Belliella pelovolcani]SIT16466.1 NAD-dependent deacetylase [Belliella pelovolcani]